MARRVFFSFHYERDIWRANVVRQSWVTQDREAAGFWDASLWEEAKRSGDEAIKRMIKKGLANTSVTAVLIGAETSSRRWVDHEIKASYGVGNGLLGVYIHNINDQDLRTDSKGSDPFASIYIERNNRRVYFTELYSTYDWLFNDGYENFSSWVEKAAKAAGR